MAAHSGRPLAHPRPTPLGRVAAWLGTRLRARRARRLEEEAVACLCAMDSKLLNDIGVQIGQLDKLSGKPPHVNAEEAARPTRHAIRRRRS